MKSIFNIFICCALVFLYACSSCEDLFYDFVGAPNLVALGEDPSSFAIDTTDLIQGKFQLDLNFNLELVDTEEGTIDCETVYNQSIDASSLVLSVDKLIKHGAEEISPSTNLNNMEGISVTVSKDQLSVEFDQLFVDNYQFLSELYLWSISVGTDTGNTYTSSISLKMEI